MSGNGDGPGGSKHIDKYQPARGSKRTRVEVDVHAPSSSRHRVVVDEQMPSTSRQRVVVDEQMPSTSRHRVVVDEQMPSTSRQNYDEIVTIPDEQNGGKTYLTSASSSNGDVNGKETKPIVIDESTIKNKFGWKTSTLKEEIKALLISKKLEYYLKIQAIINRRQRDISDDVFVEPRTFLSFLNLDRNRKLSRISEEKSQRSSVATGASGHGSVSVAPSVSSAGSIRRPVPPQIDRPRQGRLARLYWRIRHYRISRRDVINFTMGLTGIGFFVAGGIHIVTVESILLPCVAFGAGFFIILLACGFFKPLFRRRTSLVTSPLTKHARSSLSVVQEDEV